MKKFAVAAFLLTAIIFACTQTGKDTLSDPVSGTATDSPIVNSFCSSTPNSSSFCPQLPYEIPEAFQAGYTAHLDPNIQPPFDVFSWQTFIGLNWPANSKGQPVGNNPGDYPDSLRVWEYYPDMAELFETGTPLHLELQSAQKENRKYFYLTSKSPKRLTRFNDFEEASGNPLIDRNLNFVVFSVSANRVEGDFILTNKLNTRAGVDSFYRKNNKQFQLPVADFSKKNDGSMEIKTAWRILDTARGDRPERYYTREALISISADNSTTGKPFFIRAKVGLIGMHIVRKTQRFTKWIWSTFEHVDNTPDNPQLAMNNQQSKNPWSFYYTNTLGLGANDTIVFQPGDNGDYKFEPVAPYAKRYAVSVFGEQENKAVFGTQALRMNPIYYRTEQVNTLWRNKLKGTVWANYKLIGSQWTAGDPGIINTPNVPALLGNSVMETFILTSASCISCHNFATLNVNKDTIFTDFSFMIALHAK